MNDEQSVEHTVYSRGYFVRIKDYPTYIDKVRALRDQGDYTRVLSISHDADPEFPHPHYHIVIETEVKEKAFWKRMMKLFDQGKGNGHGAHTIWDGKIQACSYMFHENANANIIVQKGFTDDDIARMRTVNANVQQRIKDAKNGSHTEKQLAKHKKTIWDIVEEVRSQMRVYTDPTGVHRFMGDMKLSGDMEYPEETAYRKLIDVLEKYKIRSAEHELKRWLDTILRIDPSFDLVKKNILSRYRDAR